MPYDEDLDNLRFRDFDDVATSMERFLAVPENVTVIRFLALVQAVHAILAGRTPSHVDMHELAHGLRQRGLAAFPFNTVLRVIEAVAGIEPATDVLSRVTLRDVQRILAR
jgi:hypothetical protein